MKTQSYDLTKDLTSPSYSLAMLSVEEFYLFWPHIERELDKVPHIWKMWTKDYITSAVEVGSLVTWCIGPPPDAVFVFFTQVVSYPVGRVLTVPLGFGNFDPQMLPLLDATLTQYAILQNCVGIEIRGREGWKKLFASIGFKQECVTLARPVSDVRMQ